MLLINSVAIELSFKTVVILKFVLLISCEKRNKTHTSKMDFEMYEESFVFTFLKSRPILTSIYVVIAVIFFLTGIIGNSIILFMKLRNYKTKEMFDLLVANIAFGHLLHALGSIIHGIEATTDEIVSYPMCIIKSISFNISSLQTIFSLIVMMVFIKFTPNIVRKMESMVIGVLWICGTIVMSPLFAVTVTVVFFKKVPHYKCHLTGDNPLVIVSLICESLLPFVTIIVFFLVLVIERKFIESQRKNIWCYSLIMSLYFGSILTLSGLLFLLYMFFDVVIYNIYYALLIDVLIFSICAANPAVYFYYDRKLLKDFCDVIKPPNRDDGKYHEIAFNGSEIQCEQPV